MTFFKATSPKKSEELLIENGNFLGALDNQWGPVIHGWALNKINNSPVTVKVTTDKEEYYIVAKELRKDIIDCGLHPTGNCGFSINIGRRLNNPAKVNMMIDVGELKPSRPKFVNKQIFFMHIAKTAGSSTNRFFVQFLGDKNSAVHIEGENNPKSLRGLRYISGHIGYESFFNNYFPHLACDRQDIYLATILRSPLKQLVSHLNWVRHLIEPQKAEFLASHPPIVHKISQRLKNLDFTSPEDMSEFVETLKPSERPLFDNCQSRYFHSGCSSSSYSQNDFNKALENFKKFHFVGITERFESSIRILADKAGIIDDWISTPKENVNSFDYGFDFNNGELIESVSPLIKYDNKLYELALANQ
ncbi:hypothetical protein ACJJH9_03140 [Microbulbifer sp. DLAB2-AF]|uniref:hypothetical protein n=1 Tax=Microbulbifer sp. DLAB2-AF TaxID=3243395 RepID=UPI00403997B3